MAQIGQQVTLDSVQLVYQGNVYTLYCDRTKFKFAPKSVTPGETIFYTSNMIMADGIKNEANMLTISIANTLQNYNTVISGNLSNIGQYDSMILQGTRSDGTLVNYQATGVIRNTRFEFDLGASGAGTVDMTFTCATFV